MYIHVYREKGGGTMQNLKELWIRVENCEIGENHFSIVCQSTTLDCAKKCKIVQKLCSNGSNGGVYLEINSSASIYPPRNHGDFTVPAP